MIALDRSTPPAPWLPNWRDPAAYPRANPIEGNRVWRWECIRRNPDYGVDQVRWNAALRAAIAESEGRHALLDPTSRLFDLRRELFKRWGIAAGLGLWPKPTSSRGYSHVGFSASGITMFRRVDGEDNDYLSRVVQSGTETDIWMRFDLLSPLDEQFRRAKEDLQRLMADDEEGGFRKRPSNRSRDHDVLVRMFRAYDAVAAGVKRAEIAEELFPHVPNAYPELSGDGRVGEDLETARALVNFGFLRLRVK